MLFCLQLKFLSSSYWCTFSWDCWSSIFTKLSALPDARISKYNNSFAAIIPITLAKIWRIYCISDLLIQWTSPDCWVANTAVTSTLYHRRNCPKSHSSSFTLVKMPCVVHVHLCWWWLVKMVEFTLVLHAPSAHTHTRPFNGPLSETTQVSQYQKGKTNLDFTDARDSEWQ